MSRYTVGGVDLSTFVEQWLASLERQDAPSRGLLDHTADDYIFGASFMMANIVPEAVELSARREVLLVFTVLFVFQNDDFPGCEGDWRGTVDHLDRAFTHAQRLGDRGLAASLLRRVASYSTCDRVPVFDEALARSMHRDPGRIADHDRAVAGLSSLEIRAARLLDPSGVG